MEPDFFSADRLYDEARYEEAFKMFRTLAEKGDVSSMTRLALMYYSGVGTSKNIEECVKWDLRAAEHEDTVAYLNLGITYKDLGDMQTSIDWFNKALNQGDGEAALELAKIYLANDVDKAKSYLNIALQTGNLTEDSQEEITSLLNQM
jgi:TPR repeat protein